MFRNRLYYRIKPLLPLAARLAVRRWFALRKRKAVRDIWPIMPGSERVPTGWSGWPGGKQFALVLTHDVEGISGFEKCRRLMALEQELGFSSSFNLIPEGGAYTATKAMRDELTRNGFEVGVHDLYHDGKLFLTEAEFRRNARRINEYLEDWGAVGFRSGFMLHNLDWIHDLNVQYDASTFDTDPFEPQPYGRHTIFPFFVNRSQGTEIRRQSPDGWLRDHASLNSQLPTPNSALSGYVELPYTLPQDSTLFLVLRERSIQIWKDKLDWVAQHGGMVLLDTHPDYMAMNGSRKSWEYPVALYEELLRYIRSQYSGAYWPALPHQVAALVQSVQSPPSSLSSAAIAGGGTEVVCRRPPFQFSPGKTDSIPISLAGGRTTGETSPEAAPAAVASVPAPEHAPLDSQLSTFAPRSSRSSAPKAVLWVDLDNTPHVPFFEPILEELRARGFQVLVTARDAFQVCDLADKKRLAYIKVGRHNGKNRLMKAAGLAYRSLQLAPVVLPERPVLAVSHGARSQILLSNLLQIPTLLIEDYEYCQFPPMMRPDWVLAPEVIPDEALPLQKSQVRKYCGIKEDVYAWKLKPDPAVLKELGLAASDVIVTVRPPATEAHYHNPESEKLFEALMERACATPRVRVVLLPRNKRQGECIRHQWPKWFEQDKTVIPQRALDGMNLIWHSDLVVSGGGTMNREAAALGVPVYSIFRGTIGAVDIHLKAEGRLILIESVEDVRRKIQFVKRPRRSVAEVTSKQTLQRIVDTIEELAERASA